MRALQLVSQIQQSLIEHIQSDESGSRAVEIENNVNSERYDRREAENVHPTAPLTRR